MTDLRIKPQTVLKMPSRGRWPAILFCLLLSCVLCSGQQKDMQSALSPKLREFLNTYPNAAQLFTNILSEAFAQKQVWLYYFYTNDKSMPGAYHRYQSEAGVEIFVQENQEPLEEFISIIFEAINSENEAKYRDIFQMAQQGHISEGDFALEILRVECNVMNRTRDLLKQLKLKSKDTSKAGMYKHLMECPKDFDQFLAYIRKDPSKRDPFIDYERQYNSLQKAAVEDQSRTNK